jgi:NADH:ubiquinone oxidoreductase subunit 6 (subunit J)
MLLAAWALEQAFAAALALGWTALVELALPLGACLFAAAVAIFPNPMHALLSLLGVFFTTVLFYLSAGIAFVGLVFLIVYVGAVAVLFLFVIMLLNVKSLTAKEGLIRRRAQTFALVVAAATFQQLYTRVMASVGTALTQDGARYASVEPTTAEAVTFYVRYTSADINSVTSLYTVHALNFLVMTIVLLVALLGAIILATVTTERATALSDIRLYTEGASRVAILLLLPSVLVFSVDEALSSVFSLTDLLTLLSMSVWFTKSQRNADLLRVESDRTDYLRISRMKPFIRRRRVAAAWRFCVVRGSVRFYTREFFRREPRKDTRRKKKTSTVVRRLRGLQFRCYGARLLSTELTAHPARSAYAYAVKRLANVTRLVQPVVSKANLRTEYRSRRRTIMLRHRWLWHWRPQRAASPIRYYRAPIKYRKLKRYQVAPVDRPATRWERVPEHGSAAFGVFTLGPVGYLRYLWSTQLFPHIYYWAWRTRAFLAVFFGMMLFLPLILVPFPWFLDDYDVVWSDLFTLYRQVYYFVDHHTSLQSYHLVLKHLVTTALLYPAAAVKIVITHPWEILGLAALYAYDAVLFYGGHFVRAELQEATCNYFRLVPDKFIRFLFTPTAAQIARTRRHPDRGRTDKYRLLAISEPAAVEALRETFHQIRTMICDFSIWWQQLVQRISTAGDCPVPLFSLADLYKLLPRACRRLAYPPSWVYDYNMIPVSVLYTILVPAAIFYALAGITIVLGWRRVYGPTTRPSLLWPVVVLLVAIYVWYILYDHTRPVDRVFYMIYSNTEIFNFTWIRQNNAWGFFIAMYTVPLFVILFPYFLYRHQFTHYHIFVVGNIFTLRHFVNYYLRCLEFYDPAYSSAWSAAAEGSLEDSLARLAEATAVRKERQAKAEADARKPKYVKYKKVFKSEHPDLGLQGAPRTEYFWYKRNPYTRA